MNPVTGRCNSRNTPNGSMLGLARRYDEAQRFIKAYDIASRAHGGEPQTYYNQFDRQLLQNGSNPERLAQGRQLQERRRIADKEQYQRWLGESGERGFLDQLKRSVKTVAGGIFGSSRSM